jgi:putative ABC transport system ATP-binding protein
LPGEPAVRVERLVRTYRTPTGEVRALRDVTATIPFGGVSVVVGPSGSGKSSLLRLVAGLDRPTSGSIEVMGIEIGHASARARRAVRRTTVGYVYQQPTANFVEHLTVAQHLRLAAGSKGDDDDAVLAMAGSLGIARHLGRLPRELSGGEQQRAAVAQALASGAALVVADEPTAELDADAADAVLDRIAHVAAQGITFVLATHDSSVMAMADHRITLEHGVVATEGARTDVALSDVVAQALRWPDPLGPQDAWLGEDDAEVVRMRGVQRSFGGGDQVVHALHGVDLTVASGETIGLVGRSGSGKTTLLNLAAGWDVPDAGTIDRPGGDAPDWHDVAVVPQHLGLMDELSVRENVEYPARLAGRLEERRPLVDDLLEHLGLAAMQRRSVREISLGEQQRTSVARAVVMGPRLLVADEPTAHQDAGWGAAVLGVLREAAVAGSGCVIATHDVDVLGAVDRTIRIDDGRLAGG